MGSFSIWHWLIVLAIVVMVFGTRRLRTAGSDLGSAIRSFKDAVKEGQSEATNSSPSALGHDEKLMTDAQAPSKVAERN